MLNTIHNHVAQKARLSQPAHGHPTHFVGDETLVPTRGRHDSIHKRLSAKLESPGPHTARRTWGGYDYVT